MRIPRFVVVALCFGLAGAMGSPAWAYLDAEAAYRMALRYHHPLDGGRRDYDLALTLYCRAYGDDHAGAAYAIGLMYAGGYGVKRSDAKARAWFRRAEALGHAEAKTMLAIFRRGGSGAVGACPTGWGGPAGQGGRGGGLAPRSPPAAIKKMVEQMAPGFALDPKLVLAVIGVESAFLTDAVSSKNAQGLMQLVPATAARFGVRDAFNPSENLRGGMAYLRWLLSRFKGNVALAAAAYNAGENAVERHGGVPPYAETQNYVRKIRSLYSRPHHP